MGGPDLLLGGKAGVSGHRPPDGRNLSTQAFLSQPIPPAVPPGLPLLNIHCPEEAGGESQPGQAWLGPSAMAPPPMAASQQGSNFSDVKFPCGLARSTQKLSTVSFAGRQKDGSRSLGDAWGDELSGPPPCPLPRAS